METTNNIQTPENSMQDATITVGVLEIRYLVADDQRVKFPVCVNTVTGERLPSKLVNMDELQRLHNAKRLKEVGTIGFLADCL